MSWIFINRNGIWEREGARIVKKLKTLPNASPINANEFGSNNIVIDFEAADPAETTTPAVTLKRSPAAIAIVTKWEGYHRKLPNGDCEAYADPAHGWGVPTIGYGTTAYRAAGLAKYNRSSVAQGDTLTRLQAEDELNSELDKIDRSLAGAITAPVTQAMYDALCSFCYNVGMSGASKQIARVNAKQYEECAASFDLYVNANGRPLQGLINRRNDEEALFRSQGLNPGGTTPSTDSKVITLKRTGTRANGLEKLALQFGTEVFTVFSGQPLAQYFRRPQDPRSVPGNMEPIPQGLYKVGKADWVNGEGNMSGTWGPGLGPVWIPISATFSDDRGSFGFHLDAGPIGSAGCVVFPNSADLKRFCELLAPLSGVTLDVDWGIK